MLSVCRYHHDALLTFDNTLRSAFSDITNSEVSGSQWLQACQGGGLGIRRAASLAAPCLFGIRCEHLFSPRLHSGPNSLSFRHIFDTYLQTWSSSFGYSILTDSLSSKQSFWDKPGVTAFTGRSYSWNWFRKQWRTCQISPHSGDWLHALPIAAYGLRLDDEAIRVAVGLRLGSNLCVPHVCRCGSQVYRPTRGLHGLTCKLAPGFVEVWWQATGWANRCTVIWATNNLGDRRLGDIFGDKS